MAVDHIRNKYPMCKIYLVGFSMGASLGMKFLSTEKGKQSISGMVSVSNPWDVFKSAESLNSSRNRIYSRFLSKQLYKKALFNKEKVD